MGQNIWLVHIDKTRLAAGSLGYPAYLSHLATISKSWSHLTPNDTYYDFPKHSNISQWNLQLQSSPSPGHKNINTSQPPPVVALTKIQKSQFLKACFFQTHSSHPSFLLPMLIPFTSQIRGRGNCQRRRSNQVNPSIGEE